MVTNIGQYAPVFLPGGPPLTEKPGRLQSTGLQRATEDTTKVTLCTQAQFFFFFACGSSAPVRVECEGHAAAWLAGTLVVSSVQRHGLPLLQGLWPYLSLLSSLL